MTMASVSVDDIESKIAEIKDLVRTGKPERRREWMLEFKILQEELKTAKAERAAAEVRRPSRPDATDEAKDTHGDLAATNTEGTRSTNSA